MRRAIISVLLASVFTTGCTRELVTRPETAGQYMAGVPLPLAFTQYDVTATWRVTSCTDANKAVTLAVEAAPQLGVDHSQRFFVDPTSLAGPLSRSQLQMVYFENGTLRSINAEAEDRTGAFIGNVARIVAQLAPLAAGVPGPRSLVRTIDPAVDFCSTPARAALERVNRLKGQLETATGQVEGQTDEVLRLAAAVAQMGGAVDPTTSQNYGDALRELDRLRTVQSGLVAQLADALRPITYQQTLRWPETPDQLDLATPLTAAPVLSRWFSTVPAAADRRVHLRLESQIAGQPATRPAPVTAPRRIAGIPYRVPRDGRLVMCDRPCADGQAEHRLLLRGPVAQLGPIAVLPIRNPAFGSTAVSAEFRPDGSLASAGHAQRAAPLEEASGAVAGAAGEIVPVIDPAQRLIRETAYLNALKERRDAWQALQPAPADPVDPAGAALEADTTLLHAQIANLQARLTLQELQARMAPR